MTRQKWCIVQLNDVQSDIFIDASGREYEVIFIKSNKFLSDYQVRVYVDHKDEVFDDAGNVRTDCMLEFVSEIFREYWLDPEKLLAKYPEYYALIKETMK